MVSSSSFDSKIYEPRARLVEVGRLETFHILSKAERMRMVRAYQPYVCFCTDLPLKPERPVARVHHEPAVRFRKQIFGSSKSRRKDPGFFASASCVAFHPRNWHHRIVHCS